VSRKIDALVAEKVCGWTIGDVWSSPPPDPKRVRNMNVETKNSPWPRYSTTGDGILLVIEEMRGKGWPEWQVQSCLDRPDKTGARFRMDGVGTWVEWRNADTAPMAVCLAALKALGVEVPDAL